MNTLDLNHSSTLIQDGPSDPLTKQTKSLPSLAINQVSVPGNMILAILAYLGEELNNCRLVCKTFQTIIDSCPDVLYSPTLLNIRNLYFTFKSQDQLDLPRQKEAESLKAKLEKLETDQKTESENLTLRLNNSWFSYFVSKINYQNGFLTKITYLITKIFKRIEEEVNQQNLIQQKIHLYTQDISTLTQKLNSLTDEKSNVGFKNRSDAAIAYNHARYAYFEPQHVPRSREKFLELFGGQEAFEALPILNGVTGMGTHITLSDIPMARLTSSIMRGEDVWGREFVIIIAKHKKSGQQVYQIFHQEIYTKSLWVQSGDYFIVNDGFLIQKGQAYHQESFDQLKAFIQIGHNDDYILE